MHHLHYDDLSMKTTYRISQVHVISLLTSGGLASLCELLDVGIDAGLGKAQPTKSTPEVYCCINDIMMSIEVPAPMFHAMGLVPVYSSMVQVSTLLVKIVVLKGTFRTCIIQKFCLYEAVSSVNLPTLIMSCHEKRFVLRLYLGSM
jgi:hypothetical protein